VNPAATWGGRRPRAPNSPSLRVTVPAQVGDFGLSIRIDPGATHISDLFAGTITHMVCFDRALTSL
jgi:hypothetical protein